MEGHFLDVALATGVGYIAAKTGINISAAAVKRIGAWIFRKVFK